MRFAVLICGAGMLLAARPALAGPVIVVGSCEPSKTSLPTIQAAVTAIGTGGTVQVCPGAYPEQVTITKSLTLTGLASSNGALPSITSPTGGVVQNTTSLATGEPIAAQLTVQNATGVTISNLTVDGSNNQIGGCAPDFVGILFQNASGAIRSNAVVNQILAPALTGCQSGLAIYVQSGGGGTSTVSITGNHVANYDKNGITANEIGTSATITGNDVIGVGPTTGAGQNSIEMAYGSTGKITGNVVGDDVWAPDTFADPGDAASGILVYASVGAVVTGNAISNTQFGISISGDGNGDGDGDIVSNNHIEATHIFDAVDVCGSSSTTVTGNTINGVDESGVHLDSSCGSASLNDTVSANKVDFGCAGILVGPGSTQPATANTLINVATQVLTGTDACSPVPLAANHGARHPGRPKRL